MSDRDNDLGADAAAAAPPTAEKAPGTTKDAETKPKRIRRVADKQPAAAAETTKEEVVDMVSEGGPVGDEADRQLGVTELPAELVEADTELLEKAHPDLTGEPASPKKSSKPKAESTAAKAGAAKTATSATKKKTTSRKKGREAAQPLSSSDPLLPGMGNPSPDGTQLGYLLTDTTGSTRLWISALDGSSAYSIELPFRPVFDPEGPQWSPDGTQIALTGSAPSELGTAIWLAPVDGGDCVLLADHVASDEQPRWSPDGTLLAFASKRHGRSAICVATPDGYGPVVQLSAGPLGQDDRNPCWEPNSQRIAYTRHMIDGENEGEQIWTVSILTGEQKQATKKLAHRSQLQWCPGKSQIAFITDEAEWLNVGVVNPDNSAGWNLASESGDKSFPRYSLDGNRIMYTRRVRGEVRLVERPTSGATADPLDPGAGVAAAPNWLPDKRVVYQFSSATEAPSFVVQEAKKEVARTFIPVAGGWEAEDWFVAPDHTDYEISGGLKAGVLVYRTKGDGTQPAVILLGADPQAGNTFGYDSTIQALVQHGFTVVVPTLPGTPGYGKKIVNAFKDRAGTESEISDLVDLANWTRALDYVDGEKVYLVGQGYGGALALLLPGARPGAVDAVAVIDPVTDWDDELDQADDEFAHWYLDYLGLPSANRGKTALRTPTTFAGVLDLPVQLVGTSRASIGRAVQLERFAAALDELAVPYARETSENESTWQTAERIAKFLGAPKTPERIVPTEDGVTDDVAAEPDYVIEPVETVDIQALLLGNSDGDVHGEVETADVVDEVDEIIVADTVVDKPIVVEAAGPVVEEVQPEPALASSNVGRGMRTDDI